MHPIGEGRAINRKAPHQLKSTLASQLLAPLFRQAQGVIEHRYKLPGSGMRAKFYHTVGAMLNSVSTWSVKAHHYFGVATRKDSSSGKKANLAYLVTFHADVDFGPDRPHETREDALSAIEEFPLRPSAVVDTGNGFHCYWFFIKPLPAVRNLNRVESLNKGIGQSLGGDPVGDASRVLRIPGTYNVKDPINPKSVRLLWCEPDRRYALEDFMAYEVRQPERFHQPASPRMVDYGEMGGTAYGRAALVNEIARLAQVREGSHYRNIQLNKSAYALGRLVGAGHLDKDTVAHLLTTVGASIGLGEREIRATVSSGLRAGLAMGVAHD